MVIMNTNILMYLSKNNLRAWYLDVQFFVNLIKEHNLDVDDIAENIEFDFWK